MASSSNGSFWEKSSGEVKEESELGQQQHGDCLLENMIGQPEGGNFIMEDRYFSTLKEIWSSWDNKRQDRFNKKYGHIGYLTDVEIEQQLLKVMIRFWDPSYRCFTFDEIDMTPIIEEYTVLLNLSPKTPNKVYLQKAGFKKSLGKILGLQVKKFDSHIKQKGNYQCVSWDFLHGFIQEHQNDDKGLDAMALAIYGIIIFPKALRYINSEVINLLEQMEHGVNLVPVILAETFRSLNYYRIHGGGRFTGCAQLLFIWMKSHIKCSENRFTEPHRKIRYPISEFCSSKWPRKTSEHQWLKTLQNLGKNGLEWKAPWMTHDSILYRCGDYPWVPLLGLWGIISYAPVMVRRQIGSEQFIPMTHGLDQLDFLYGDVGAAQLKDKIAQAWKQEHRTRPGNFICNTTAGYITWHKNRVRGVQMPSPNSPLQIADEPKDYQAENDFLIVENRRLKDEMEGYKNQVVQSKKHARQLERFIDGIAPTLPKELEEENSKLSDTVEELIVVFKSLKREVNDLEAGLEIKTAERDIKERRNHTLQVSMNDMNHQIHYQCVKIQDLTTQCEKLNQECQRLRPYEKGMNFWIEKHDQIDRQVGNLILEIVRMARQARRVARRTNELRQIVLPGQLNADQLLSFLDDIYEQFIYFGEFH